MCAKRQRVRIICRKANYFMQKRIEILESGIRSLLLVTYLLRVGVQDLVELVCIAHYRLGLIPSWKLNFVETDGIIVTFYKRYILRAERGFESIDGFNDLTLAILAVLFFVRGRLSIKLYKNCNEALYDCKTTDLQRYFMYMTHLVVWHTVLAVVGDYLHPMLTYFAWEGGWTPHVMPLAGLFCMLRYLKAVTIGNY